MKAVLLIFLVAFANIASAQDLSTFVNLATNELTGLLGSVGDLIDCVTGILSATVNLLVKLVKELLTLDISDLVNEVVNLIPNILQAAETACSPILNDIFCLVKSLLTLIAQFLEAEGSVLAKFLGLLIELLLSTVVQDPVSVVTAAPQAMPAVIPRPVLPLVVPIPTIIRNATVFKNETMAGRNVTVVRTNSTTVHAVNATTHAVNTTIHATNTTVSYANKTVGAITVNATI